MNDMYDQIERYKTGKMTGEERVSFERDMREDEELRKAVDDFDVLKKAAVGLLEVALLRELEVVKKNIKEESKIDQSADVGNAGDLGKDGDGEQGKHQVSGGQSVVSITRNWLKYAAGLLLLVAAGWLIYQGVIGGQKNATEIFAEYYQNPPWPGTKSGGDKANYIEKATSIYLNGDFERAKVMLQDSSANRAEGNYWLAHIYLTENKANQALEVLPKNLPEDVYPDTYHYLKTMIYLKLDSIEEAEKATRSLSEDYRDLKVDVKKLNDKTIN